MQFVHIYKHTHKHHRLYFYLDCFLCSNTTNHVASLDINTLALILDFSFSNENESESSSVIMIPIEMKWNSMRFEGNISYFFLEK